MLDTDAMLANPTAEHGDGTHDDRRAAAPYHWALRRVAERIRDARQALGTARLVRTAPAWLVQREYLAAVKDLREPLPPLFATPGLAWRPLARAEVSRLVASSPTLSPAEVLRRLGEGQECWVAWLGATAVHWRWEARRNAYLPYLHRSVRPLRGDLWVVEVYTHPSRRGQGLYATGSLMAMQRARAEGDIRLIGLIAGWNRPARRVAEEKQQRAVVGSVGYWGLGRWRHHFVTGDIQLDGDGRVFVLQRSCPAPMASTGLTV